MTSGNNVSGVIAAVQRDHREIERMFGAVEQASGDTRRDAFEDLVRKLAVHETAEEEVVHPLARKEELDAVVDALITEESSGKEALAQLDGMDVTAPAFDAQFAKLKRDVMAHAQHEEREEHPKIMERTSVEELERRRSIFETAEKMAPTHPHPSAPASESVTGNLTLGPIMAVADRVRDAMRDAMKKN